MATTLRSPSGVALKDGDEGTSKMKCFRQCWLSTVGGDVGQHWDIYGPLV